MIDAAFDIAQWNLCFQSQWCMFGCRRHRNPHGRAKCHERFDQARLHGYFLASSKPQFPPPQRCPHYACSHSDGQLILPRHSVQATPMRCITVIFLLGALLGPLSIVHGQQVSQPTSSDIGDIQPADPNKFYKKPGYSPYAGKHYPERPLFGDEHVHTAWSVDAGLSGATLDPVAAVRFARGEQVTSASGQPVRLSRPLDWVAVTDHSDAMGTVAASREGNPEMMQDPTLKRWHDMMNAGLEEGSKATFELVAAQSNKKLPPALTDPKWAKTFWEHNTAIMEEYNQPGRFTAFIAYEWTSNAGGGDNLHRNVIYRDDKKLADQVLPMTTFQSENPEDLWKWMAAWEKKTGGQLLAIPHNGNLSNGRMFELRMFMGGPMTREWAEQRQKYEPLFEAIQMKGQSESHPS